MANKLKFFWRMGDFALEACDKNLLQRSDNVTIELVKYYRSKGKEFKYSLNKCSLKYIFKKEKVCDIILLQTFFLHI